MDRPPSSATMTPRRWPPTSAKGRRSPRVQQGNSIVDADHIEYFRERQDLVAKGHVDSTFDIVPTSADGQGSEDRGR